MFSTLQAANGEEHSAEGTVQCSECRKMCGGEEEIVGSLNTVLLCGCIPKCFSVCAWAMHHPVLHQTTHARGSTSFGSILATEQTLLKV